MGLLLLVALIGIPLLEIAVFVKLGGAIGLWPTLALVVLGAFVGAWQLRAQGLTTLTRARAELERGAVPTRELFDGACLLIAGAFLLTPGFVTDALGLLLFLPPLRTALRRLLVRYIGTVIESRVIVDGVEIDPDGASGPIIEGEYRDVTETAKSGRSRSRRRLGG